MKTASPGAISRISLKSRTLIATLSEAIMNSVPASVLRSPKATGLIPFGSRNPNIPTPVIIATAA